MSDKSKDDKSKDDESKKRPKSPEIGIEVLVSPKDQKRESQRPKASIGVEYPPLVAKYDGAKMRTMTYAPVSTNKDNVKVGLAILGARPGGEAHPPPAPPPQRTPEPPPPPPVAPPPPPPPPPQPAPPPPSEPPRPPSPETKVLVKPVWNPRLAPHGRGKRSIIAEVPINPIAHSGTALETTTFDPVDTTKQNIKVQFAILKRKPTEFPAPPPPPPIVIPPPPPLLLPIPKPPTPRTQSAIVVDYINILSGLSREDLQHDEIPSPEFADENVDVIEMLNKFGIPDQARAIDTLLDKDTVHFDFGGLMRQYYSYVLRSYCLINMQERYRGAANYTNCFTSVDLSKIGTRDEEMEKYTRAKLRKLNDKREELRKVAVDDDHFNYLKTLADNQATLLPLTIVHTMNEQLIPVLEDIFRFYGKNLGTNHKSTKEAGFYYMKIRKRCEMYNNICGGSTLHEDLSQF